jgi:hypothetical protein
MIFATTFLLLGAPVYMAVAVLILISLWWVFEKADQPGWACLIPIWNLVVILRIVGRPWWFILLMFVLNGLGLVIWLLMCLGLAKSFGRRWWFGVCLALPVVNFVFFPILAFGQAQYLGPSAHD